MLFFPQTDLDDKSSYIMPLALLHAVLLQRRYYGNIASVGTNYWSVVDLVSMAEVFKSLSAQCNCLETTSEIMTQVYSNQCTDPQDAEVIKAIGAAILKFPGMKSVVSHLTSYYVLLLMQREIRVLSLYLLCFRPLNHW